MTLHKINIGCLNALLVQIMDGIFEPAGPNLEHFDAHILRFKDRIDNQPEDRREKFREELAEALSAILNNTSKLSIDNLINDAIRVYMKDEDEARQLMEKIWTIFFPNRSYVSSDLVFDEVQLVDEGCDSW